MGAVALVIHGWSPISVATNNYEIDSVYKTTSAPPSPPSPKGGKEPYRETVPSHAVAPDGLGQLVNSNGGST
jgi:hypothetical protein